MFSEPCAPQGSKHGSALQLGPAPQAQARRSGGNSALSMGQASPQAQAWRCKEQFCRTWAQLRPRPKPGTAVRQSCHIHGRSHIGGPDQAANLLRQDRPHARSRPICARAQAGPGPKPGPDGPGGLGPGPAWAWAQLGARAGLGPGPKPRRACPPQAQAAPAVGPASLKAHAWRNEGPSKSDVVDYKKSTSIFLESTKFCGSTKCCGLPKIGLFGSGCIFVVFWTFW